MEFLRLRLMLKRPLTPWAVMMNSREWARISESQAETGFLQQVTTQSNSGLFSLVCPSHNPQGLWEGPGHVCAQREVRVRPGALLCLVTSLFFSVT